MPIASVADRIGRRQINLVGAAGLPGVRGAGSSGDGCAAQEVAEGRLERPLVRDGLDGAAGREAVGVESDRASLTALETMGVSVGAW